MQIAAMRPKYLTRDEVPADVVATERRIAEETAREEGKPEQALPKIIEGRVNAFFKDFVLLEQPSVTGPEEERQGGPRRGRRDRTPFRALRGGRELTSLADCKGQTAGGTARDRVSDILRPAANLSQGSPHRRGT